MIKYIMRKTIYKKLDKETQDMLLKLNACRDILGWFCSMSGVVNYIVIFIPVFIIYACEDIEMTTTVIIAACMIIYVSSFLVFWKVFQRA